MPKRRKYGRGVEAKELCTFLSARTIQHHAGYRPVMAHRSPDPIALKRAFMLQNFQFILRDDFMQLMSSQGLPHGRRRLYECLRLSDSLIPWEAVHSVVVRMALEEFECPICLDTPAAPRISECGHIYCLSCMLQYIRNQKRNNAGRICPVCNQPIVTCMLRPCVLHPIRSLSVDVEARFDLFVRERMSCILRRYDDPFLRCRANEIGATPEAKTELPRFLDPSSIQSRYLVGTNEYETNQRRMDAIGISERLSELKAAPRPLNQFDTDTETFLIQALDAVTKEQGKLSPSLSANSPPIAPRANDKDGVGKMYEMYAEAEGQPYYLHMVMIKMLKHDADLRQRSLPESVCGRIVEIVTFPQTEETKCMYKVFAHIPLHGTIKLCILDLRGVVLPETLHAFKDTLDRLESLRHARRKQETDRIPDISWQDHLQSYSAQSMPEPSTSDFSCETDSMSHLHLPSTGSVGSDHGMHSSPLDTHQRATKKKGVRSLTLPPEGTLVDSATVAGQTNQTNRSTCWFSGGATRLFGTSLSGMPRTDTTLERGALPCGEHRSPSPDL